MTLQHHLCEVIIKMAVRSSSHEKAAFVASVSPIIGVPANTTCLEGSRWRARMLQHSKFVVLAFDERNCLAIWKHAGVGIEAGDSVVRGRLCQVVSFVEWKAKRAKVVLHERCYDLWRKMNTAFFSERHVVRTDEHSTVNLVPEVGMLSGNAGSKAWSSLLLRANPAVVVCDSCNKSPASTVSCHITIRTKDASRPG